MELVELLDQYSIVYKRAGEHKRVSQGWIGLDCPFCGRQNAGQCHLGYNLTTRACTCWRCGVLRLVDVLAELTGEPVKSCWQMLRELDAPLLQGVGVSKKRGKLVLPKALGELLPVHRNYLQERGFDPDFLIRDWKIQGIGFSLRLAWRLFIPIEYQGEVVSWTTRAVKEVQAKYVNAREDQEVLSSHTLLYGEDHVRHTVIICEGPTDVWRIGFGAVATLGVGLTSPQVLKLAQYPRRVVCLDSDEAGKRRARELCDLLEPYPGETVKVELDAKDPGSATAKEVRRLRKIFLE